MIDRIEDYEALEAGTAIIAPEDGLREKLEIAKREGRPMIVKLGFDPTAPDLHLGHAVVMRKLREFQNLGHTVKVIIGNFTAEIGDPTGNNKMRPPLSPEQVAKNAKTYLTQLSTVLDLDKLEIVYNAEWFDVMTSREMIRLMAQHTLSRIMERDDFANRFKDGTPIALHELVYPLLQGYDSFVVNADIEIGGTDQLFNCLVGRHMQEVRGKVAQTVICMPLLVGTDGKEKMSKSKGNYIGLVEDPNNVYGKVMSIPDSLLEDYLRLATDFSETEKQTLIARLATDENPMVIKKLVAHNIVRQYNDNDVADGAEAFFRQQIQNRSLDNKQFEEVQLETLGLDPKDLSLIDLCAAIDKKRNRSEIRRLIKGGGISIEDTKITDITHRCTITDGTRLKIGKRGYYMIRIG